MSDFRPIGFARNPAGDVSGITEMLPGDTIPDSLLNVANTTPRWNASAIQDIPICTTDPTTGQSLVYNGSQWCPSTISVSGGGGGGGGGISDASSLNTIPIDPTVPTNNQVLSYNGSNWIASTISFPNVPANTNASAIRNIPVSSTAPSNNQVLVYNGQGYIPSTINYPVVPTDTNASAIRSVPVSSTSPTTNQVLTYNGQGYIPSTINYPIVPTDTNASAIRNVPVSSTSPTTNQVLVYNGQGYVPSTINYPIVPTDTNASAIRNVPVSSTSPTTNQVLVYNGQGYVPSTINYPVVPSETNASALKGFTVSATTPTTNQALVYTGTGWAPSTITYPVVPALTNSSALRSVPVSSTAPNSGEGLVYDGVGWKPTPINAVKIQNVNVSVTAPTNGDFLKYDGAGWKPTAVTVPAGYPAYQDLTGLSNTSVDYAADIVRCDATDGDIELEFPYTAYTGGRQYTIIKTDNHGYKVRIWVDTAGVWLHPSQDIYLTQPGESVILTSNGTLAAVQRHKGWGIDNNSVIEYTDDFLAGRAVNGGVGTLSWNVGIGTVAFSTSSTQYHPGVITLTTNTTPNAVAYIKLNKFRLDEFLEAKTILQLSATNADYIVRFGLMSDITTSAFTDGIYWERNTTDARWQYVHTKGSSPTPGAGTPTAEDLGWHTFRIFHNPTDVKMEFYSDGTAEATPSYTSDLDVMMDIGIQIIPTTSTARAVYVDLISFVVSTQTAARY